MMKNPADKILYFIAIFILTNCTNPSGFQYLHPEYQNKKETHPKVLVLPINSQTIINASLNGNDSNVIGNATFREAEMFKNYIKIILGEKTQTEIATDEITDDVEEVKLEKQKVELDKLSIEFQIPKLSEKNGRFAQIDYLVIFDKLYFTKLAKISGSSLGSVGESTYLLSAGIEYIVWDNKTRKLVSYGKVEEKSNLLTVPQKGDYLNVIEKLADVIIQKSPFAAKKIYF
ncbi:MAG: hypothetical protein HYZ10_03620 [Ignavibacteriales bacterium]|nr:hypothetical protein [Ignavibacteriales bacterium]